MREDGVFPRTRRTWIDKRLGDGRAGRDEVNHHLMEIYGPCLRVWYLGSSFRVLGESDEIVNGFFADRLPREDFLLKWRESGKLLRHWLIIAFGFFLKETLRRRKKDERFSALPAEVEDRAQPDEAGVDQIFAEVIVDKAGELARERCRSRGLAQHWEIFHLHRIQGLPYSEVAARIAITADRAAVMSRTAERHFVHSIWDLLSRDGILTEEMQEQLRSLLKATGP